jgi:hypothetical protein
MKFRKENGPKASSFACCLQHRLDFNEIWLIIEHSLAAALVCTLLAFELRPLSSDIRYITISTLLKNHSHSFEEPCLLMPDWEIKGLWHAIPELPITHWLYT